MAGEIVEGVNPTRMELLSIRKKRLLAEKGHKLLGEKRDALVVQFFEVLKKREKLKGEVVNAFSEANLSLEDAMARMGYDTVKAMAQAHLAERAMRRVIELQPDYYHAGAHLFLLSYYASRPP
ncbi:MAG: TRAP transporter TatT component family protein, partial [Thermoplasmatota archaeon]